MTRSRRRKLSRERAKGLCAAVRVGMPFASALLTAMPVARAQQVSGAATLQTIVVTAQKISQNLQNVPISLEVFDNRTLRQLNIVSLDDYVEMAPALSYSRSGGGGNENGQPGDSNIFIRGVANGASGAGSQAGSQPTVAVYLGEQPFTTITGVVPLHLYDINRIEVLEGPQGTLFGASSEAGAVRIIANTPDPKEFSAGYNVQGSLVQGASGASPGGVVEGFVNLPLSRQAAIRLVAWDEHDGGYISNVAGTDAEGCVFDGVRSFPTWAGQPTGSYSTHTGTGSVAPCATGAKIGAGAITNAPWRQGNFNPVDTAGGRAELKFDLGEHWTITPSFQGQSLSTRGSFGYDPTVGDLQSVQFGPDHSHDTWTQSALTIQGRIHNFDLVYAGGYIKRNKHSFADYSDYSEFYDKVYGSGPFYLGNNSRPIMPQEFAIDQEIQEDWSQELRVTTPLDEPVHATAGLFIDRKMDNEVGPLVMPGYGWQNFYGGGAAAGDPNGLGYLPPNDLSVPGFPNAIWLTDEQRVDRDRAIYGEATWDITQQWHLTAGLRYYHYDNSLLGFAGFNANFLPFIGTGTCFEPAVRPYSPCTDVDGRASGNGTVPRANVTYNITPHKMIYATYSKGFRPGGTNETPGVPPYQADYLTNYEVGWKTQWLDNTLRWNGALFWEAWKNFQFSFTGEADTELLANAGQARIKGLETSVEWLPVRNLFLSTDFTFLDPVLTQNYCGQLGVTSCADQVHYSPFIPGGKLVGPLAPAGTNLPITPKFKGNIVARYSLPLIGNWNPYVQLSWMYQTETSPALQVDEAEVIGDTPAYALGNFKIGAQGANGMHFDLFVTNVTDRRAQLSRFTQTNPLVDNEVYIVPAQPRTFGLELGQDF